MSTLALPVNGTRPARREALALAGLATLLAAGAWLAVGAASGDLLVDTADAPEPGWLAGPLRVLGIGFSDGAFSAALLLMTGGYVLCLLHAEELRPRPVLLVVGALIALFTLTSPLLSSDVFGYVGYARLGVLHHLNPYTHGVIAAPRDPVLPFVYWQHPSSPYGPLFTLGSYALAQHSLPAAVWVLKLAAGAGAAGAAALALRLAGARGALLVGANPLLLAYGVGGAHNDLLVLPLVLGGLVLLGGERERAAGGVLALAAAVKLTGGIALAFLLPRRELARGALAAGALLGAGTLLIFGPHVLDTIGGLGTQNSFNVDYTGPDLLGRLLGTGVTAGVRATCAAGVLFVMILCLRRRLPALDTAGWTTLAGLCAIASFVPWYVAWVLPLALVARSRRLQWAVLALTSIVVLMHLPLLGFPESQ